ncbi:MAG TPA: alpha/beta fold hydrolase [Methanomicrobia archaeon]|nr:alpha/beta fold hydrolase [Methanomicrobia archaeon]
MPKVAMTDLELHYHEEGSGFPLVLLHGLSDDARLWTPLLPVLSKTYRTIALDLRGHGHSGKPDTPYSIQHFSTDLFEFFANWISQRRICSGFLLVALSPCTHFALVHPEKVRALVLISSFCSTDPALRARFEKLRESLLTGGCGAFFDEAVALTVTPKFAAAHAAELAEAKEEMIAMNSTTALVRVIDACMAFDVTDKLSQLALPTLIISGREDTFTPCYFSEQIYRAIPGSTWAILDDAAHNVLLPGKIQEVSRLVLDFLDRYGNGIYLK